MATSRATKKGSGGLAGAGGGGSGGVIGAIRRERKQVDQFPLMSYVAKNCTFEEDAGDLSLDDEEFLKAANDQRVEELLKQAAAAKAADSKSEEAEAINDVNRRKALELLHSLEHSRNQEETWKIAQLQSKKGPDYKGFLHPLNKKNAAEEEYFSGTRKIKPQRERKRTHSEEIVVIEKGKLVPKESTNQLPIEITLPPRGNALKTPRVPSVGLPFTPASSPPLSGNNPWMNRGGSALFSNVHSNTIRAYGINCNEEEAMALAIAESLRTAKLEQEKILNFKEKYQDQEISLPAASKGNVQYERPPPDPEGTVWSDGEQIDKSKGGTQIEGKQLYGANNIYWDGTVVNSVESQRSRLDQRHKYSNEALNPSKVPAPVDFKYTKDSVSKLHWNPVDCEAMDEIQRDVPEYEDDCRPVESHKASSQMETSPPKQPMSSRDQTRSPSPLRIPFAGSQVNEPAKLSETSDLPEVRRSRLRTRVAATDSDWRVPVGNDEKSMIGTNRKQDLHLLAAAMKSFGTEKDPSSQTIPAEKSTANQSNCSDTVLEEDFVTLLKSSELQNIAAPLKPLRSQTVAASPQGLQNFAAQSESSESQEGIFPPESSGSQDVISSAKPQVTSNGSSPPEPQASSHVNIASEPQGMNNPLTPVDQVILHQMYERLLMQQAQAQGFIPPTLPFSQTLDGVPPLLTGLLGQPNNFPLSVNGFPNNHGAMPGVPNNFHSGISGFSNSPVGIPGTPGGINGYSNYLGGTSGVPNIVPEGFPAGIGLPVGIFGMPNNFTVGMPGVLNNNLGGMPGVSNNNIGGMPGVSNNNIGGMPGVSNNNIGGMPGLPRYSGDLDGLPDGLAGMQHFLNPMQSGQGLTPNILGMQHAFNNIPGGFQAAHCNSFGRIPNLNSFGGMTGSAGSIPQPGSIPQKVAKGRGRLGRS